MKKRAWPGTCGNFVALIAVIFCGWGSFAAGNVVKYTYDAAGNVTNVSRQLAAGFAITSFSPTSGAVGAAVTIYGTGFSATPANNNVKFNGVTATVSAADAGSISTTVPAGATTGRITVTVAAATATSAQDFVVVVAGAPVISALSPISGVAGTSVAVSGTDFGATPGSMTAKLNGVTASATLQTGTAFSFVVPGAAASGRVTATTSAGTGASGQDFIVPPTGVSAADILDMGRLAANGGAVNVAVGTPGKHALLLFDLAADTYYTIQMGQLASTPSSTLIPYKVVKPDNTTFVSGNVGSTQIPTIHLPRVSVPGTYSLLVSPGVATFNSNIRLDSDPTVSIDGASVAVSTPGPTQTTRVVVDLSASQRVGVGVTGYASSPVNASATSFVAYKPDGTQLGGLAVAYCSPPNASNVAGNCDGEMAATVAGAYTVVATPAYGASVSFGMQLTSETSGTLLPDISSTVTLTRVGQDARYTFSGTAGDSFGVSLSGASQQPQAQTIAATVWNPNGTSFVTASFLPPSAGYAELGTLATTGTYAVTLDPAYGAYGSLMLTLKQGALLGTSDPPAPFAPATASEAARFRFNATAGQRLAVGLSGLTGNATLTAYGPTRTQAGTTACFAATAGGRCMISIPSITASGTYSIAIVPSTAGAQIAGNASLTADTLGSLSAGVPQVISVTREAQVARFTFSAAAGDTTSVKLWNVSTTPASQAMTLNVYKPDGSYLAGASVSGGSVVVPLHALPVSGSYTAVVVPTYGTPWQGTIMLDPGTTLQVDGATASLASTGGEPLRYRFTGTAGQRLEVGIGALGYSSATSAAASVSVLQPSGGVLLSMSCYTPNGCKTWSASLPSTGTYSLSVVPPATPDLTSGTLALSTPATGTFVTGDPAQVVAIARPGQTARYAFSGTSGQLLRLQWNSPVTSTTFGVAVQVWKPDGTLLSSGSLFNAVSAGIDVAALPVTGTYTVVMDPPFGATFSASMSLATR